MDMNKRTHRREGHTDYKERRKAVRDPSLLRRQVDTPDCKQALFKVGRTFRTSLYITMYEKVHTEPFHPHFGSEFLLSQTAGAFKV